jgi:restriction system protein
VGRSNVVRLFDLAARLPWLVSGGIAALSWFVFHELHRRNFGASWVITQPGAALNPLADIVGGVSVVLQWALPLVFGVGAAVGFIGRLRRSHLFQRAAQDSDQLLTGMNWEDFERLVADTFTRAGYEVRERGGAQADGGVDLVVYRDSQRFLVQCKQW